MISIFAKPAFVRTNAAIGNHIVRVSSRVRGDEIGAYIGAKLNGERSDVNIFLKPRNLDGLMAGDYIDMLDDSTLVEKLKERPDLKIITMSQIQYEYVKRELPNEVVLIHHHHINIERARREPNNKLIGGFIGHSGHAQSLYFDIKEHLSLAGIEFVADFNSLTRKDAIKFYKSIDFLVVWNIEEYKDYFCSHPTKLINAASFGVPTLSQPIAGYKEFDIFYIPITDMNSLVEEAEKMKDKPYYKAWSDKVFEEAEKYHISKIAKLYEKLL